MNSLKVLPVVFLIYLVGAPSFGKVDPNNPDKVKDAPEGRVFVDNKNRFMESAELVFANQSTTFYFSGGGSGSPDIDFNSNTSLGLGAKLYTNYGAFSLSFPLNSKGDKDTSEPSTPKRYTGSFDFRYDFHYSDSILVRGKYLQYSGFYEKGVSGVEVLRKNIELFNYELSAFQYYSSDRFPVKNQTNWKSNFETGGSSLFSYLSLYSGEIASPDSILGSSYDASLGEFAGLRNAISRGIIVGGGLAQNYLGEKKNWNFLWAIGMGANVYSQSTKGSLGSQSKTGVGISVSIETGYNYKFENDWFAGLAANYLTQSTPLANLDLTMGNMDIKMLVGIDL